MALSVMGFDIDVRIQSRIAEGMKRVKAELDNTKAAFGRGSILGDVIDIGQLQGPARALGEIMKGLRDGAKALNDVMSDAAAGTIDGWDAARAVLESLPFGIGQAAAAGRELRQLFSGERSELEALNRTLEENNRLSAEQQKVLDKARAATKDARETAEAQALRIELAGMDDMQKSISKLEHDRDAEVAKQLAGLAAGGGRAEIEAAIVNVVWATAMEVQNIRDKANAERLKDERETNEKALDEWRRFETQWENEQRAYVRKERERDAKRIADRAATNYKLAEERRVAAESVIDAESKLAETLAKINRGAHAARALEMRNDLERRVRDAKSLAMLPVIMQQAHLERAQEAFNRTMDKLRQSQPSHPEAVEVTGGFRGLRAAQDATWQAKMLREQELAREHLKAAEKDLKRIGDAADKLANASVLFAQIGGGL